MKNYDHYDEDAFTFYKTVCARKNDGVLKTRLAVIDPEIQALFTNYDNHFATNSLELLMPKGYINQEKSDLLELYQYDSATLRKLREKLTTNSTGRVVMCQNCTMNQVNTFDHSVPQGEFCEYAVHPKNLICCCSDCNSRKSSVWRHAGSRTGLNLYTDHLPNLQYLFVIADVGNTLIETQYYLDNVNGVDATLFGLITEHYTRLNLFQRFSEASDTVISSFRNIMEPLRDFHDLAETKMIVLQSIQKDQAAFGFNYWQSILKLELLNNDDFMIGFE